MTPLKLPQRWAALLLQIATAVRDAGGTTYMVGGCVRDLLLGTEPEELDLEVFGLPAEMVEKLFENRCDFVGKSFGIYHFRNAPIDLGLPRRERQHGPLHRDFAVSTDPFLSLEEAALRRDFTFNAIYYDILAEQIIDPYGGQLDLKNRRLRHVSERFAEDPLRVLRGMQFVARLGLNADPETVKICNHLNPSHLSAERIFSEFRKLILQGIHIGDGLEFLYQCGWTRFFPELDALRDCPQDPRCHPEGSVWNHTKYAMDAFAKLRPQDRQDALVVGFATLCHDLGKPLCTVIESNGRIHSWNHATLGIAPTRRFLESMRAPVAVVEQVLPLVERHMEPRKFHQLSISNQAWLRRLSHSVMGRIDLLLLVARSDTSGRHPAIPDLSVLDNVEAFAKTQGLFDRVPQPLVLGRDLIEKFHFQPSPRMGIILSQLFEHQLDGKISTHEEGLELAEEMIHALPSP